MNTYFKYTEHSICIKHVHNFVTKFIKSWIFDFMLEISREFCREIIFPRKSRSRCYLCRLSHVDRMNFWTHPPELSPSLFTFDHLEHSICMQRVSVWIVRVTNFAIAVLSVGWTINRWAISRPDRRFVY